MFLQEEEFNDDNKVVIKHQGFLKSEENEEEVEDLNFNYQKNNSGGLQDLQRRYSTKNIPPQMPEMKNEDNNEERGIRRDSLGMFISL